MARWVWTMARWVCPLPDGAGSFVRVDGRWHFGRAPLPDGAGSFVRVDGQWPFGCAHLPDGAVDTALGCRLQNAPKFYTKLNLVLVHRTAGQRPRPSQLSLLQMTKTHKNKGQRHALEHFNFLPFSAFWFEKSRILIIFFLI